MTEDIFSFWSRIDPSANIHPDDQYVLSHVQHPFSLKCLPGPYKGRLRDAPVVLLFLSPGLHQEDELEATTEKGQKRYIEQRKGYALLPGPDEHLPSFTWWSQRTALFGEWEYLRDKIAILNIGAYHSENFPNHELLASLASSRKTLEWAQSVLFPQAINSERVVICMRSNRFWGLKRPSRNGALFVPEVTPGGHMHHGKFREQIVATVKQRLGP